MKLTASSIVKAIDRLPKNQPYQYIDKKNGDQIEVVRIASPEGPIIIKRYNPAEGGTSGNAKEASISPQMIWRVANAFQEGRPISIDRVLGASYNTRSVLEALLVHTPQFYFCYPGRIENINSSAKVKRGHKHIVWRPDTPHDNAVMKEITTDIVISEIPNSEVIYDALAIPEGAQVSGINIDIQRRHAQIQIALVMIGKVLGFQTWVAQNDKGIKYKGKPLGEMEGVIAALKDEKLLISYPNATKEALLIDCIWFKDGRLMPAVLEVEHTTGITSGLTRMKKFQDTLPPFPTRYVIVADEEDREKAIREANQQQFKDLNAKFLSYKAVEELLSLCQRRPVKGVTENFIDTYLENLVS